MPASVDVAIPVYERSTFVAEAVRSVLAQTRGDWRLTVSEDGPGNAAVRAAVEPFLDDPRISHVTTGTRVGLAAHKTRLIRTGSAPYVAILDDDDLWDEDWLARRVEFLERHPECGFVFSEHLDIDDGGTVIGETPFLFPEGVLSRETFMRTCMQRNVVGTPTMLVRRTAYEACGDAFDTRFPRICDYEVALRLGAHFDVGYLRTRDARYRLHTQRMSLRHDGGMDFVRLVDHLDALLVEHLPQLRLSEDERRRRRASWLVSAALDAIEAEDRGEAGRLLRRAAREDVRALMTARAAGAVFALLPGERGAAWLSRLRRWAEVRRAGAQA